MGGGVLVKGLHVLQGDLLPRLAGAVALAQLVQGGVQTLLDLIQGQAVGLGDVVFLVPQVVVVIAAQGQVFLLRGFLLAADERADAAELRRAVVLFAQMGGRFSHGLADSFQKFHTDTFLSLCDGRGWGSASTLPQFVLLYRRIRKNNTPFSRKSQFEILFYFLSENPCISPGSLIQ